MAKINLTETRRMVVPEEIYGMTHELLAGRLQGRQEFVAFEVPRGPVLFMKLDGTITRHDPNSAHRFGGPRLIVEERRLRRVVYTETGEVRCAENEWFIDEDNIPREAIQTTYPVAIATMQVEEVG